MKNKELKKAIKKVEKSEVEKALEVLQKEKQTKTENFMKDYRELCIKHGLELTANPEIRWAVTPIEK